MAYMITFRSSIEQPIMIDEDVESFVLFDDKLIIRFSNGVDDMHLGVHSISPFYYEEG